MSMKFFAELIEDVQILEEEVNGTKNFFISGPFMVAEVVNRNNRRYPLSVMEKEVSRYVKEAVAPKRAFGELGHPSTPSINLDRVSHLITELKINGNTVFGKAKILDTPHGNIAKTLAKEGCVGVSSRAVASLVQENGIDVVQEDFRIATAADIVADPSAPDAFVKVIMEGVDLNQIYTNQGLVNVVQKTQDNVNKAIREKTLTTEEKQLILLDFFKSFKKTQV